jgi:hypothetical protein
LVNERNKLKATESDWNLAGVSGSLMSTRTRNSGQGRPNLQYLMQRREAYCSPVREVVVLESSDSEYLQESSSSSEDDKDQELKKPPALQVILEVSQLTELFDKLCNKCPSCGGKLSMALKTTCLATSMITTCTMRKCGFIHYSTPPAAATVDNKDRKERSTDYAINVFVCCGISFSW